MDALNLILLGIILCLLILILVRNSGSNKDSSRFEDLLLKELGRNREELGKNMSSFAETFSRRLDSLTESNQSRLDKIRETIENQLRFLQEDNSKKLEKMRETVDEKLHSTLEKRLGESFKLVSERLEKVHEGLGEMQTLASGVGDLKKVLTNVKTRGTWGEIQLEMLLEQILSPEQYEKNVVTKEESREQVEFVIKLPGRDGNQVLLPIDAKYPKEDYERLLLAEEKGDIALIEESKKALESRLKLEAKKIKEKYINPPKTTDFGVLFLPAESLFAEVLRRPGLSETLQREYRVTVAGPTTIAALLNSLQMGFRTLAVEKRASEVWALLGSVKHEFNRFGEILDNTQKKLRQASEEIESAAKKSRTIEKKLKNVQDLPAYTSLAPDEEVKPRIAIESHEEDASIH
ncbi:MAG: DNA recombination protein RmuC [Candidatus Omnitrophica bacterium]|nr:DNA recombination protein RmuC [Candidatus Omnitrophota bacterium]